MIKILTINEKNGVTMMVSLFVGGTIVACTAVMTYVLKNIEKVQKAS
ncbi:hypothetical protein [Priestia koreensis]|nr:hypothetical protein [Priestia koreensis]